MLATLLLMVLGAVNLTYSPHPITISEINSSIGLLGTQVDCNDDSRYVVCVDSSWPIEELSELTVTYLDSWETRNRWVQYPTGELNTVLLNRDRQEVMSITILPTGRVYYLVWME